MTRHLIPALIMLTSLCFPEHLFADQVILKNGDVISGKVLKIDEGELHFKSDLLGTLKINMKDISTFQTDEVIELKVDDEVIASRIGKSQEGTVKIQVERTDTHELLNLNDIISTADVGHVDWEGRFSTGITGSEGNSDTFNLNFTAFVLRKAERTRTTFDGRYLFEHGDSDKLQDEWVGDLKHDYFFTVKTYGFGTVRAQRDDIANLNLRLSASPGVGYQWMDRDELSFATEAGPAYLYENFSNGDDSNSEVTARLAYFLNKKLFQRLSLFHDVRYFPAITDPSDFFLTTSAGIRSSITNRLFTEIRATLEHDSTPAEDKKKTDLHYTVGIGYSF